MPTINVDVSDGLAERVGREAAMQGKDLPAVMIAAAEYYLQMRGALRRVHGDVLPDGSNPEGAVVSALAFNADFSVDTLNSIAATVARIAGQVPDLRVNDGAISEVASQAVSSAAQTAVVDAGVKPDYDAVLQAPQVSQPAAPELISPTEDASLANFPRSTTVTWSDVPGASEYVLDVEYCEDEDCTSSKPLTTMRTKATTATFDFVGMQPGRWRVGVVDANGVDGLKSDWRRFRYTV